MKTTLKLNLLPIIDSTCGEIELLAYFVKLHLLDYNIPVVLNPANISWQPFEVETGQLDWHIDTDTMTMEIAYVA